MNSKVLVGLVVLLVGAGAGWYFLQGTQPVPGSVKEGILKTTATPTMEPTVTVTSELPTTGASGDAIDKGGVPSSGSVQVGTTVSYGSDGFSPKSLTVKKGSTVRWTNQSQSGMWVASAIHPTHQLLPGFDQLKSVNTGGTYEYAFTKVGTWKYHNHVQVVDTGSIVVTE